MAYTYLTFQCELREETDTDVIETLKRKGWIETPQPSYDPQTQYCIWEDCDWVVNPIIIPIPEQVAFWSFRVQLKFINKFNDVQNLIDNLQEPDHTIISTQWEYGNFIKRTDDLTLMIISANILTSEEMDDIFKQAYSLTLAA